MKTRTVTLCWGPPFQKHPGRHVNRWGRSIRSVRLWWGYWAVAWYRMDDEELVANRHAWEGNRDHLG